MDDKVAEISMDSYSDIAQCETGDGILCRVIEDIFSDRDFEGAMSSAGETIREYLDADHLCILNRRF